MAGSSQLDGKGTHVTASTPARSGIVLLIALCAAGCQPRTPAGMAATPEPAPRAAPAAPTAHPDAALPAAARSSRYAELKDCRLLEARPDEAGYRLTECDGPARHALRVVESDGRFNVMVRVPGGEFTSLRLSELGNGAFSQLGERVEWRGAGAGEAFVPDMLVLRYAVADVSADPARETSYLVPVALAGEGPCVAALVKPGPGQSDQARRIADAAPGCLARG